MPTTRITKTEATMMDTTSIRMTTTTTTRATMMATIVRDTLKAVVIRLRKNLRHLAISP